MAKVLFIDDERKYEDVVAKPATKLTSLQKLIVACNPEVFVARTYDQAIKFLSEESFDMIFFDHDLGGEKSGMDIAKWIAAGGLVNRFQFYVHSANPEGARNINSLMLQYNHYLCDIEHHVSCYNKSSFQWEWQTVDHLGIWAFGGANKDVAPRFKNAEFLVPVSHDDKVAGWYCYIGPEPQFDSCPQNETTDT